MDHTNNTRLGSRGEISTRLRTKPRRTPRASRGTRLSRCRGSSEAPSIVKARSHWGMILTVPTTPTLVPDASLRVNGRGDGVPVG